RCRAGRECPLRDPGRSPCRAGGTSRAIPTVEAGTRCHERRRGRTVSSCAWTCRDRRFWRPEVKALDIAPAAASSLRPLRLDAAQDAAGERLGTRVPYGLAHY